MAMGVGSGSTGGYVAGPSWGKPEKGKGKPKKRKPGSSLPVRPAKKAKE